MRTRLAHVVPFAAFAIILLAQADTRLRPAQSAHDFPVTVVEGTRPTPRFERPARAPVIPTKTTLPVRRDFRERVVASVGAL